MRPEAAASVRSRPRGGFTLLEVLAAVAVLGLAYAILATSGIQGLRMEGDTSRRLRASLLADQRITEIEAQAALGQAPPLGTTEGEEGEFLVLVEVGPLDLQVGETEASKRARDRLERAIGAQPRGQEQQASFLQPVDRGQPGVLRRIDVTVAWADGETEQSVQRTTYALDGQAAAPLLQALAAAAEAEKARQEGAVPQADTPAPGDDAAGPNGTTIPLEALTPGGPGGDEP